MLTVSLLMIFVPLAILITDFRRHLQIEKIHVAYAIWIEQLEQAAYEDGFLDGQRLERQMNPYIPYSSDPRK